MTASIESEMWVNLVARLGKQFFNKEASARSIVRGLLVIRHLGGVIPKLPTDACILDGLNSLFDVAQMEKSIAVLIDSTASHNRRER